MNHNDAQHIKNELWYKGEPYHMLHEQQLELLEILKNQDSFLTVLNCARQFGKTYFAVMLAFMHCLQREKNVVKYGAAHYTDLEKFIFPTIHKIIDSMPPNIRPEVVESKKVVRFYNGSMIDLVGLDLKPDGMRGNSVSLAIIEEAGYVKRLRYIYFDVVVPMFMHTQKLNPKCVMLGTPAGDLTHDFTNFFFPKAKREKVYFHKTIDDNPLLTDAEKQRVKDEYMRDAVSETDIRIQQTKMDRELYGKVSQDLERAIIPEWDDKYIEDVPRDEFFQFYHRYTAMDYGVGDKTVFLSYYYDFKKAQIVYEGEFWDQGGAMTTDLLYANVKKMEHDLYEGKIYRRVADTTNLLLLNDFAHKYKMPFLHVKKDLLHVMVNEARVWIKSGRVRINPMCRELIGCLQNGLWNDKKTAFSDSDLFGHWDALAAFVYSVRIIDQQTNPIPVTYGLSKDAVIVNQRKNNFSEKIKKVFNAKF